MSRSVRCLEIEEIRRDLDEVAWERDEELVELKAQIKAFHAERRRRKIAYVKRVFPQRVKRQEEIVEAAERAYRDAQLRNMLMQLENNQDPVQPGLELAIRIGDLRDEIWDDRSEQTLLQETEILEHLQRLLKGPWKKTRSAIFDHVRYGPM